MSQGWPGIFPGALTTGYQNIGAVGKNRNGLGWPGLFPGGLSTGSTNIGAVQKPDPITGTLASTLADTTMAATGTDEITGILTTTLDNSTMTASGLDEITGALASTLADCAMAATGIDEITGIFTATLDGCTMTASGVDEIDGVLAATLDDCVMVASGTVVNDIPIPPVAVFDSGGSWMPDWFRTGKRKKLKKIKLPLVTATIDAGLMGIAMGAHGAVTPAIPIHITVSAMTTGCILAGSAHCVDDGEVAAIGRMLHTARHRRAWMAPRRQATYPRKIP